MKKLLIVPYINQLLSMAHFTFINDIKKAREIQGKLKTRLGYLND